MRCRRIFNTLLTSCPSYNWIPGEWEYYTDAFLNLYVCQYDEEDSVFYVDDVAVYVRSEKSADRVMHSVSSWLERKLFLKVNVTKTKVVRPGKVSIWDLGFGTTKGHGSDIGYG